MTAPQILIPQPQLADQLFSGAGIRSAEAPLLAQGHGDALMRQAAWGLASAILRLLRSQDLFRPGVRICGLIGGGNNGGDGLWALTFLARRGMTVAALRCSERIHAAGATAFTEAGGRFIQHDDAAYTEAEVIIDAVLGTGARGAYTPPEVPAGALVVACDIPSGVAADTGEVAGSALPADLTVTFGGLKTGLIVGAGADYSGQIELVDIGLAPYLGSADAVLLNPAIAAAGLVPLARVAHKYTRGVVGVLAGSTTYPGAAQLVCAAATATGVGMVRYWGQNHAQAAAVITAHPEVVPTESVQARCQSWVVGSGLGRDREADAAAVFAHCYQEQLPLVVDADALNYVDPQQTRSNWVLTPHAGEAAALFRRLGGEDHALARREAISANPIAAATELATLTGATIVLKGPQTVISDGQHTPVVYCEGHPGLATAGSGDTLSGVLGGILAGWAAHNEQAPWLNQIAAAVAIHGRAGAWVARSGPVHAGALAAGVRQSIGEVPIR